MSNIKHKIFFGFTGTVDVDGDPNEIETFKILTQAGDAILTQAGDFLIQENDG